MYKILIADDEVLLRKEIIVLLKRGNIPFRSIVEAENGYEALKAIEEDPPDIAILDIKMPGMSGIELSETVHRKKLDTKVIIVSGYADFSFARDALRFGVVDYILKPIDDDKFYECIEKTIQLIVIHRNHSFAEGIENRFYKMVSMLHRNESIDTLNNDIDFLKGFFTQMAVVLCHEKDTKYSIDELVFNLYNILKHACKDINGACTFKNKLKLNEIIVITWTKDLKETSRCLESVIRETWDLVSSYAGNCISIGISETGNGCASLPFLYTSCHEALKQRFYDRSMGEIYYHKGDIYPNKKLFEHLFQTVDNISHLVDLPHKTFNSFFNQGTIRQLTMQQIKTLFSNLATSLIPANHLDITEITGDILDLFNSIDEITDYLNKLYEHRNEKENIKDISNAIPEICSFIKANYNKEISLTWLAEKYNVNPNYLSEVFKEKTGVNFKDYLLETRMQVAKELLTSTKMSIKDISFATGYNSQGYFQKVFKKRYNLTPMDYRATFSGD